MLPACSAAPEHGEGLHQPALDDVGEVPAEEPTRPVDVEPVAAVDKSTDVPATEGLPGRPAVVELRPVGLSSIYAGYVSNRETAQALADDLGRLWPGMKVVVEVSWTSMEEGGQFRLFVPFGEARAGDLSAQILAGESIDIDPVQRMLAPLGRFRAALGARFDLRFLGFTLEVVLHDPKTGRACSAPGALNDPGGATLGRCFRCETATGSSELCREGESWPAVLSGEDSARRQLAGALATAD